MESASLADITTLINTLRTHQGAIASHISRDLEAELAPYDFTISTAEVMHHAVDSLVGSLEGVLLAGTTEPLAALAQWQLALLRNRQVQNPHLVTLRFITIFVEDARAALAVHPHLAPVADAVLSVLHQTFQQAPPPEP